MTYQIVIVLLIVGIARIQATDYCDPNLCRNGATHIACNHSGQFADICPDDAALIPMTAELKEYLINGHNEHRNFIAGGGDPKHDPACRMASMTWDDELASIAVLNVLQCKVEHEACRNTDAFKWAGQSLAYMYFPDTTDYRPRMKFAMDFWYNEYKYSNMTFINSYPPNHNEPNTIAHFTQMMLGKNFKIGCAAARYSHPDPRYKYTLVACNYALCNIFNYPIYKACTRPAEKCLTGTNPAYPNLCSVNERYDTVNQYWLE